MYKTLLIVGILALIVANALFISSITDNLLIVFAESWLVGTVLGSVGFAAWDIVIDADARRRSRRTQRQVVSERDWSDWR